MKTAKAMHEICQGDDRFWPGANEFYAAEISVDTYRSFLNEADHWHKTLPQILELIAAEAAARPDSEK